MRIMCGLCRVIKDFKHIILLTSERAFINITLICNLVGSRVEALTLGDVTYSELSFKLGVVHSSECLPAKGSVVLWGVFLKIQY